MNEIYASIDLGSDSIKVVVCEKIQQNYHVLACTSSPSSGIKNGFVVDMKAATNSVKNAVREVNEMLGTNVTKVVACVPPSECSMDIVGASCDVEDYNNITGRDVSNIFLDAIKGLNLEDEELVTAMPIHFNIDEEASVHDPKGMKGTRLSSRVVVSTTPKEPLYRILEVLRLAGLETIDICYSSYGDYYTIKDKKYDELVGAIINIGAESTNISIFNRGIQIKNGVVPVGSHNVDKDLTYVYKCSLEESKHIKECFSVADSLYADGNDYWKVRLDKNTEKEVSQVGVSKVVESRVREILNVAKNEIKNLTNREIRYIIVTGGLTELSGFHYLVEKELGFVARTCEITTMGIRSNSFSSSFGAIKYFNEKLDFRGKQYKMFDEDSIQEIVARGPQDVVDYINNEVFNHFFDD